MIINNHMIFENHWNEPTYALRFPNLKNCKIILWQD